MAQVPTGKPQSATVTIVNKSSGLSVYTFLDVTDIGKGIVEGSIFLEQGKTTKVLLTIGANEFLSIEENKEQ